MSVVAHPLAPNGSKRAVAGKRVPAPTKSARAPPPRSSLTMRAMKPAATAAAGAATLAAVGAGAVQGASLGAAQFGFTPVESLLGGLTLGILASSKFVATGRILGISGIVGGVLRGGLEAWRLAFVVGLLSGGLALRFLFPAAFEPFPAAYNLSRALLAGLLVGVGTSLGSGCTSGHGICGNARLSLRSFVATLSFMASGAVAAHLSGAAALFGLPASIAPLAGSAGGRRFGAGLLAVTVAVVWALAQAARSITRRSSNPALLEQEAEELEETPLTSDTPPPEPVAAQKLAAVATFTDLAVGFLFALGLGVSGMVRPSKVTGFLSVLSGTFDPSLMFVMGGALLIALPVFQAVLRFKALPRPLSALKFELPTKTQVDPKLVVGSVIFGAGWGIGGVCPGPGLVALATLQPQVLALVGAMLAGQVLSKVAGLV